MATSKKTSKKSKSAPKHSAAKAAAALGETTKKRATKLALNVIDFQKTTFDNAVRMLAAVQGQSERLIQQLTVKSNWMAPEGKLVVEEWIKTVNRSREDFKHTMDKSFDLLTEYLKRVQAQNGTAAKPAKAPKKRAKK